MKTLPFFRLSPLVAELAAAKPVRYPYHDDAACSVGQAVKRSGEWTSYEPTQVADTRLRCPVCIELSRRA